MPDGPILKTRPCDRLQAHQHQFVILRHDCQSEGLHFHVGHIDVEISQSQTGGPSYLTLAAILRQLWAILQQLPYQGLPGRKPFC